MDFFGQQARAQANSKRLGFFFILAVMLTNASVYLAVAIAFRLTHLIAGLSLHSGSPQGWLVKLANHFASEGIWNWELLGWVSVVVLTVLLVGTSYKLWQLSRGGAAVAELLGGRLLSLNPSDPDERRLLHLVEEMAIASGLPVPDVYLLDEESGINAFAAGDDASAAVIGVTFGALKLLNRDELQGMVAHEFSHILNGDMRLRTRLIGWLHGILGLVVLGRILSLSFLNRARTADGERVGPIFHPVFLPAFVLGWICMIAGSFGAFFARLIKSAVSRQREYLADAAAVQFTRNPDGLVGALKKIGGLGRRSLIGAARAEEASHLYFSDGMSQRWFGFLATHPPLTERIQRIDSSFDGKYPAVSLTRVLRESKVTTEYRQHGGGKAVDFEKLAGIIGPAAALQEMLYADAAKASGPKPPVAPVESGRHQIRVSRPDLEYAALFLGAIPDSVRTAASQTFSAVALVYGMVASKNSEIRARQIAEIADLTGPGMISELTRLLPLIDELDAGAFLPLSDLSLRALRQLSPEQYQAFRATLEHLVAADQQMDLFEYMLQRMVVRHLDPHFRPVKRTPVQYYTLRPLIPDCAILLSGLARVGQESEETARMAFDQGAAGLMTDSGLQFLSLAECNLPQMDAAINRIAQATPQLKQQILTALLCTAATDGRLKKREAELLRAIADAFGSPIPPFLCAAKGATP
jgi:Zn-dependent protease with chaperone function/uncharacterized tellurite resistance protein B-like protein